MDETIELAVLRAINTMRNNLGEQLTVDDMARAAMFSKFHFTRIFQRATGVSPGRFLSALRLQRAKHLLVSTSLNVADISLRVGYNSVGTFSSRFTRSVGMSPTTYRRRAGYAMQIATDAIDDGASTARVHGRIWSDDTTVPRLVFLGLFPDRIPQGRPVSCAVLARPGHYELDAVPPGTWYLLAQSVPGRLDDPDGYFASVDEPVSVASHGPLTITSDSEVQADLRFKPVHAMDPPVLLALLDVRKLALSVVTGEAERSEHVTSLPTPLHLRNGHVRPSERTAA